jgi:hypothetical protein
MALERGRDKGVPIFALDVARAGTRVHPTNSPQGRNCARGFLLPTINTYHYCHSISLLARKFITFLKISAHTYSYTAHGERDLLTAYVTQGSGAYGRRTDPTLMHLHGAPRTAVVGLHTQIVDVRRLSDPKTSIRISHVMARSLTSTAACRALTNFGAKPSRVF